MIKKFSDWLIERTVPLAAQRQVGRVLFGSDKLIAKIQGKGTEKDTSLESEMLRKLKNWTKSSTDMSSNEISSTVEKLIYLKKHFPEVLEPPRGEKVFRGTSVPLLQLSRWIKQNPEVESFSSESGDFVAFLALYPYKPKREISSWTSSLAFATSFRGKEFDNYSNVPVIFETIVDDTFIMNPEVMNVIFKRTQDDLGFERELIRDENEVIKFKPEGKYKLILEAEEYKTFTT